MPSWEQTGMSYVHLLRRWQDISPKYISPNISNGSTNTKYFYYKCFYCIFSV